MSANDRNAPECVEGRGTPDIDKEQDHDGARAHEDTVGGDLPPRAHACDRTDCAGGRPLSGAKPNICRDVGRHARRADDRGEEEEEEGERQARGAYRAGGRSVPS